MPHQDRLVIIGLSHFVDGISTFMCFKPIKSTRPSAETFSPNERMIHEMSLLALNNVGMNPFFFFSYFIFLGFINQSINQFNMIELLL